MKSKVEEVYCSTCPGRISSPFSDLTDEQVRDLESSKTCAFFKKGQIIFHEGNRPNGVYCVRNGKVKVSRLGVDGKEQIIRFVKGGDLIGYRSLLSGENLSATVSTLEETHACFVPSRILLEAISSNPKFSLELMKRACHELGEASKLITNLAQKSVRERIAEVLLIIRTTFGEDREGFLDLQLTREELANMVGTATESVIRLLSEFKTDDLIELSGRKIKVLEPGELARIGKVFD